MSCHRKARKRRFKGRGSRGNTHHVYPRSRRKKGDLGKFEPFCQRLLLTTEIKKHAAWHQIFYNLFAEEVISLIKEAFKSNLRSPAQIISFIKLFHDPNRTIAEATKEDLFAWQELFGSLSSWRKIKKTIIKNWMYPGVRAIVSGKGEIVALIVVPLRMPRRARFIKFLFRCRDAQILSLKNGWLLKII